jgi:hypothetical protein
LAKAFKSYGVASEALWGADPHRAYKLQMHREGHIKVLCNCQILTEGYDDWRISCIVLARPTQSEGLYQQVIGRGTRIQPGIVNLVEAIRQGVDVLKRDCLILDFVDNTTRHNLITLPSLFGLGSKLDLKGKTVTEALEAVKAANLRKVVADAETQRKLKAVASQVDLFKVQYAPEIIQFSEYKWHKTGPSAYVLLLQKKENVVVLTDVQGRWFSSGSCNGQDIYGQFKSLENAIKWTDQKLRAMGGKSLISGIKRNAPWHAEPPSESQLQWARTLKLKIPANATRGELSAKFTELQAKARTEAKETFDRILGQK